MRLAGFACLTACLVCFALLSSPASPRKPEDPEEVRALWVVRFSLTSPQAVRNVVQAAKKHHFNTLFVQVRGRGDAWHRSDLEPRAEALQNAPADFDPLALILKEAHREGIKVHAWLNTFLTWTGKRPPLSKNHVVNAHPEWIARDNNGRCSMTATEQVEGLFLQPSNPAVQDHLFRVFTDVARRYDIDGIHFDYVRYPHSTYDFAPATLQRFKAHMDPQIDARQKAALKGRPLKAYVHTFAGPWADWRRAQVTQLVRRISDAVHDMKPWVQVSAAVFANQEDARKTRGQDWTRWLAEGYLDAVCPMAYSKDTETVARQIQMAVRAAGERHVYAGIGSWRLPADDTIRKISRARAAGARGVSLFSYDGITADGRRQEYLNKLTRGAFPSRAGVPGMRWRGAREDPQRK